VTNGIEINHVSMIDCDRNATFSDVAILKYWKVIIIIIWIELLNQMKINYKYLLFVMIHIKIKIWDNSTKILKNDMWKNEKWNWFFKLNLLKR
jgi:hypothetical protein